MSAKIVVVAGTQAGAEHWIEHDILRVGSDKACELCLQDTGIDPHALTIRYANQRYAVYNRGSSKIRVDQLIIDPNKNSIWKPGGVLRFAGGAVLRLDTDGNGAPERSEQKVAPTIVPSEANVDENAAEPALEDAADTAPANSAQKQLQLVFAVVFFGAAIAAILWSGSSEETPPATISFDVLVTQLRDAKNISPDLWVRLSEARAMASRGRKAEASQAYRRLRDRVELEKDHFVANRRLVPHVLDDLEDYVKNRLAASKTRSK